MTIINAVENARPARSPPPAPAICSPAAVTIVSELVVLSLLLWFLWELRPERPRRALGPQDDRLVQLFPVVHVRPDDPPVEVAQVVRRAEAHRRRVR